MPFLIPLAVAIIEGADTWTIIGAIATAALGAVSEIQASQAKASEQHQADSLTLQMGETPRRVLAGNAATGGDFLTAWNDGSNNEFETMVIKLSDVQCNAIQGYWIDDNAYGFTGSGAQAAFNVGGQDNLWIWFQPGTQGQVPPTDITSVAGDNWTVNHRAQGCCHVIVRYRYNTKVWVSGRPRFKWVVQGALVYDPRYDSTVAGGSGPCTWGVPSTYFFSDNLGVIAYNYVRGFYNGSELMVGYGATADQAPPDRWIAGMNTCDEIVALKAGGQEFRYHGGGVISADEAYITVLENLADCMGGIIVPHQGGVEIAVGTAQTFVVDITDASLADGKTVDFNPWRSTDDRVNSVTAQYNDPNQQWNSTSAPMRRVYSDVVSDGKPFPATPTLIYCNSNTQAQRCAEIQRRKKRLERTFQIPLPARYCDIEAGDWIRWTSNRYFGGDAVQFLVTAVSDAESPFEIMLTIEEIAAPCFSWVPATDEITPGTTPYVSAGARTPISLSGVALAAVLVSGGSGVVPALQGSWTPPADPSINRVLMQVRKTGTTAFQTFICDDPSQGIMVAVAAMAPGASMDARFRPDTDDDTRAFTWSNWLTVTVGGSISSVALGQGLNVHPTFAAWSGGLPDNYAVSGLTVTKNTVNQRYGDWCADLSVAGATDSFLDTIAAAELRMPPAGIDLVACDYEVEWLGTGDFQRTGFEYRVNFLGGFSVFNRFVVSIFDDVPTPVLGQVYKFTRVVPIASVSGTPSGNPTSASLYVRTNNTGFSGSASAAKNWRHHKCEFRVPTAQERSSYKGLNADGSANQLSSSVIAQIASGGAAPVPTLVQTGLAQDGVAVTFGRAYPVAPRITFLEGGKVYDSSLTGAQIRDDSAVVSTTGFTPALKLKQAVGTTTPQSVSLATGATTRDMDKPTTGDAWNDQYTAAGSVIVAGRKIAGDDSYQGSIDVAIYSNSGSGFVERGRVTLAMNSTTSASQTLPFNISFSCGALGSGSQKEFRLALVNPSNTAAATSSFTGTSTISYATATAPTAVSRTTADQQVRWRAELGVLQ